jgi:hypothetical protein
LVGDSDFPFFGMISDLNMWNNPLSVQAIQEYANCNGYKLYRDRMPIQWSSINVNLTDDSFNQISIAREDFITDLRSTTVFKLFSTPLNFQQALSFCYNLNGSMVIPGDQDELDSLFLLEEKNFEQNCNGMIWINAVHSTHNSSLWLNGSHTSEEIKYLPWMIGQPNGNEVQDCISASKDGYSDNDCQKKRCFICKMSKYPVFHLRGPFTDSQDFDTKYVFLHDWKNNPDYILQGFSALTKIVGNRSTNSWDFVLNQKQNVSMIAQINDLKNLPFGTKNWTRTSNDGKNQSILFLMKLSRVCIIFFQNPDYAPLHKI